MLDHFAILSGARCVRRFICVLTASGHKSHAAVHAVLCHKLPILGQSRVLLGLGACSVSAVLNEIGFSSVRKVETAETGKSVVLFPCGVTRCATKH